MAEPAVVPVKLDVNDISLQGIKVDDVQKDISQKIGNISSSINSMLSNVDTVDFTQKMNTAFSSVEKRLVQTMSSQQSFNNVVAQLGRQSDGYKRLAENIIMFEANIGGLRAEVETFLDTNGNVKASVLQSQAAFDTYRKKVDLLNQAEQRLANMQNRLANPAEFVKVEDLNSSELDVLVLAYEKIKSSVASANAAIQKFNTTSTEGKMTDPYQQYQADADKLTEKLEKLNEKAKQMGQLGATDAQWEKLRYEIDSTQGSIDEVVKKMRKMVNDRSAFRFDFNEDDIKEARTEINKLNREQKKLADNARTVADAHESPYSEQYKEALKQLAKYEQAVDKLKDKAEIQLNTGASDEQIARTKAEASQLNDKIQELLNNMRELVNSGDAFKLDTGNAAQELSSIDSAGERLQNTLAHMGEESNLVQRLGDKFKELGNTISSSHPVLSKIAQVTGSLIRGFGSAGKAAKEFGSKVKESASNAKDNLAKITNKIKPVISGFKNIISKVNIFRKSGSGMSNSMNSGFKKMTKNLLQFGLGFRSLYFLIKRLRKIFTDALIDIGQQFPDFGAQVNGLKQSFNALKGSVGTAFQPLASAVIPVLQKIMDYATTVLEVLGKFNAALTGQNFIYKANAKAIDASTDAKKKSNAEDKKQLASYDKLEVIKEDKDTNSGSSSGTDSGVTYTKESLDSAVSTFAEAVKDAWSKADFTEIGKMVGTKLSSTLDSIEEFIPEMNAAASKVGKSIATFVNGFVSIDGLGEKLGKTFTDILNVVIKGLSSFVDEIEWDEVGTFIGQGLNSILTGFDFSTLGSTIATGINGLSTTIINAVSAIDFKEAATNFASGINNIINGWEPEKTGEALSLTIAGVYDYIAAGLESIEWAELGKKLVQFIKSIDYGDIADSVYEAFGAALGSVASFLIGVFTEAISDLVDWWNDTAFENGEFTLEGLLNGIWEGIKDIGTWIKEHIFDPFIEGFKKAFGIHSPSTEMETLGGYLIDGLKNGVSGIWDSIKSKFTDMLDNIKEWFSDKKQELTDAWNTFTDNIKEKTADMKAQVKQKWSDIKSGWNKLTENVKGKTAEMKAKVGTTWSGIRTSWNNLMSNFRDKTVSIALSFSAAASDLKSWINTNVIGKINAKFLQVPILKNHLLPYLAQGAVIPPNREFLAVLGDQRSGTNIEAPLDTIKQALAEVIAEIGDIGGHEPIELKLDGKVVAKVVWDESKKLYKQTGKSYI